MDRTGSVQVVGSRPIFSSFVQSARTKDIEFSFQQVSNLNKVVDFPTVSRETFLTVVVDPDDYSVDSLRTIEGGVCLWFFGRFALPRNDNSLASPPLFAEVEREIKNRMDFLTSLPEDSYRLIVVSDPESRDFLASEGYPVILSPPPVDDALKFGGSGRSQFLFYVLGQTNTYNATFVSQADEVNLIHDVPQQEFEQIFSSATHVISLPNQIIPTFRYEFAVSAVAGKSLLSSRVAPLWGFEPGIDFFEVSTPSELKFALEHICNSPQILDFMAKRARIKAGIFLASNIWPRLIERYALT